MFDAIFENADGIIKGAYIIIIMARHVNQAVAINQYLTHSIKWEWLNNV
ncbi:hypothetical protein [Helicobacter pylori]|nr:hypothetical protein [Helicobacter pylori]